MKFTIKTDLSEYTAEELAAEIARGEDIFTSLTETPDAEATAATVAEAREVIAALETLSAEQERRAADANAVEELAALRDSRVTAASEEVEEPEAEVEEPEAEEEAEEPEVVVEEKEPVAASGKRAPATTTPRARVPLAGKRPAATPPAAAQSKITITASADVPGFVTGGEIDDLDGVAKAVIARSKSFPSQPMKVPGGALQRYGVALIHRPESEFVATGDANHDYAMLQEAAKESRLKGGNLIAAGGWCSPSETLYDLCDPETTEGLIDLPEVTWSRGGIRYTEGPQFSDLYGGGFLQTEAQAIAGTAKPCVTVSCPTWVEERLDATGLCIKVPLLTNATYPELVRRFTSGSLTAHMHWISANLISRMVTVAGAPVVTTSVGSGTTNALNGVALIATQIRQDFRLGFGETLEVVAPHWLREALRADLANRSGVDMLAVTNQMIDSYFAVRGVRVQYVYNWQDLVEGQEGYPATANLLVYPAGTFVRGGADVISLDAVYDAASLSVNEMTGLFTEEGIGLAKTCMKAKQVTIALDLAGSTGAADNTTSFTLTP